MKRWAPRDGFTIVELLIVVVVIAILAAITIVAFNGIQQRSEESAMQSTLSQAAKKVQLYAVDNSDQFPASLNDAGVSDTSSVSYQYSVNNSVSPKEYCVTATRNMTNSYYVSSSAPSSYQSGICPGHNILVWYETVAGAATPVPTGVVDATSPRSAPSSLRFNAGVVGSGLRTSPFTVVQGQQYTVSLWIRTDAGWNGTAGNSKIRFGNLSGGALLTACAYNGVKLTWTQATCVYTIPAGVTGITISVGNDGTVGSIWIDDLSVSVTGP